MAVISVTLDIILDILYKFLNKNLIRIATLQHSHFDTFYLALESKNQASRKNI